MALKSDSRQLTLTKVDAGFIVIFKMYPSVGVRGKEAPRGTKSFGTWLETAAFIDRIMTGPRK